MMGWSIPIILTGFLFSAFFSGVETGSYKLNRIRLRHLKRERNPAALLLAQLLKNPHIFVFTVLIGNNLAIFFLSKEVTDLYFSNGMGTNLLLFGFIPWNAEMAATLTLMFPLFLFGEVGPKNLFRLKADTLMYHLAAPIRFLVLLFYPLTWPLKQLFNLLTHGIETDPVGELHRLSPDALKTYFSVSEKEGVISSHQNQMVESVTSMHRVSVKMLMTPLRKAPVLPDTSTVDDFKQLAARRKVTYAILMHRHMVVGIVDMLPIIKRRLNGDEQLKPYAEDVLKLEENRNLKSAFYRLRRNSRHSAVVLDTHQHPVGFVRLEDIARYITRT